MTIKPNEFTLPTIFNACAKLNNDRAVKVGKKLLDQMPDNFLNNTSILNSAIHMLFKFGDVKRAEDVFESIKNKDIISYGAMMNGNILVRIYIEL
jgi:pentatricopeptide repeat protein